MYWELRSKAGWSTEVGLVRGITLAGGGPVLTCIFRSISSCLRRRASCWMFTLEVAAGIILTLDLEGVDGDGEEEEDEGKEEEVEEEEEAEEGERKDRPPSDRPVKTEGGASTPAA